MSLYPGVTEDRPSDVLSSLFSFYPISPESSFGTSYHTFIYLLHCRRPCMPASVHPWVPTMGQTETRESWYPMADSCPGSEANKSEGRCVRRRKGHRSCGHYKGMWELKWTVKLMSAPCHFGLHQNVPPAPVQAYPHLNIGLMQM